MGTGARTFLSSEVFQSSMIWRTLNRQLRTMEVAVRLSKGTGGGAASLYATCPSFESHKKYHMQGDDDDARVAIAGVRSTNASQSAAADRFCA